ncbi:MAG TPA: hypothetical protein VGB63_06040 [Pedobacter sp.]|jgi:hypothetical protein
METKDNEQYSTPQNTPKPTKPEPRLADDEKEKNIRSGASEVDQLEKLQPKEGDDKAPGELGSAPNSTVNSGE